MWACFESGSHPQMVVSPAVSLQNHPIAGCQLRKHLRGSQLRHTKSQGLLHTETHDHQEQLWLASLPQQIGGPCGPMDEVGLSSPKAPDFGALLPCSNRPEESKERKGRRKEDRKNEESKKGRKEERKKGRREGREEHGNQVNSSRSQQINQATFTTSKHKVTRTCA